MGMRRADAVRGLARELTDRCGVLVAAEYEGPRSGDGRYGGWTLSWAAGPGRDEMRGIATSQLPQAAAAVDLDTVRWERGLGTEQQAATAVLAWMADHPDRAADAVIVSEDALPAHPDQLPAAIRRRAATLASAGWRHHTAGAVHGELLAHARRGWPAVAHWLDALGQQQDAIVLPLHPR